MSIVHDPEFETEEAPWQATTDGPDEFEATGFEFEANASPIHTDPDELDDFDDLDDHGDHDDEAEMRLIHDLGLDCDLPDSVSLDLDAIMGSADDDSVDDDLAA